MTKIKLRVMFLVMLLTAPSCSFITREHVDYVENFGVPLYSVITNGFIHEFGIYIKSYTSLQEEPYGAISFYYFIEEPLYWDYSYVHPKRTLILKRPFRINPYVRSELIIK